MSGTRVRNRGRLFSAALVLAAGLYLALVLAMLVADATYTSPAAVARVLARPEIRHAFVLSFATSTLAALLSVAFAIPIGYLLSRRNFPGRALVDALLDVPILLPPMVIGISLLILFQTPLGRAIEAWTPFTYEVPGIVLAQFAVACAFAIRTLRVTFDGLDSRAEGVARTLGATPFQAFWHVTLPEAGPGVLAAGLLAFARALGEFGPVLVFSGTTRMKTEVLPSTVFLELSVGDLEAAVAVSLVLVVSAMAVLVLARAPQWLGKDPLRP